MEEDAPPPGEEPVKKEDDAEKKAEKEVEQKKEEEAPTATPAAKDDDKPKPRPLHKTTSIFLRNLAPTITKQEVEAVSARRRRGQKCLRDTSVSVTVL